MCLTCGNPEWCSRHEELPAGDARLPLPFAVEYPVLGIRVRVESNVRGVMDIAESAFGHWRVLADRPDLMDAVPVLVRLIVQEAVPGTGEMRVEYRRPVGGRMFMTGPGVSGMADTRRREAIVYVPPEMVAAVEAFRYQVLEAAVLFLVTGPNRYPVHGAAVGKGGAALVLAGPSGSGKSTVSFAAGRAGWSVASDDVVYLQSEPRFLLWGGGGPMTYLPADAARFFPELTGAGATVLANGKIKLALRRPINQTPVYERAGVCLLRRGPGAPRLDPLPPDQAARLLQERLEPGFDAFADVAAARLAPLVRAAWTLSTGDDPLGALPLLEQALATLTASP